MERLTAYLYDIVAFPTIRVSKSGDVVVSKHTIISSPSRELYASDNTICSDYTICVTPISGEELFGQLSVETLDGWELYASDGTICSDFTICTYGEEKE